MKPFREGSQEERQRRRDLVVVVDEVEVVDHQHCGGWMVSVEPRQERRHDPARAPSAGRTERTLNSGSSTSSTSAAEIAVQN